jgi:riboflavin synthase
MFTGIVEETGRVIYSGERRLAVAASAVLQGVKNGDSIAVNGICLTVTLFDENSFDVDVMPETFRRTNLGKLRAGDEVNLERAMQMGGRMGGHLVQGHVDGTGVVRSLVEEGEAVLIEIEAPPEVMRYIVPKGFIAVNGVSLTVVRRDTTSFWVSTVIYTRKYTTTGKLKTGAIVNLEADIIGKYVEQFIHPPQAGITYEYLQENGFLAK